MDSLRKRILENVIATLQSIDAIRTVVLGTFEPSSKVLPCVGLVKPATVYERANEDLEEATLRFELQVAVDKTHQNAGWELEDVIWQIDQSLAADRRRGGLAEDTRLTNQHRLYADDIVDDAAEQMFYEIAFMKERKDPRAN